jgi:molecular chaperone DnaK
MRQKIDYGIDLGTTNSSICRMEKGVPMLMRTDTLREVMPSCVSFTRRQNIKVGESAYNDLKLDNRRATLTWRTESQNTFQEFKRTMGTDTVYHSSHMQHDYSSIDLSAQVLKALKALVTDEQPQAAVVTVPAKFTVNQKTATLQAAEQAGFTQCELLQEPIAAAMAYGLSATQKDGCWLVFDFGGGTFDAALLRVEDGIIRVADTEGDNYLGGKNLDYAIVDRLLLPHLGANFSLQNTLADEQKRQLLREALKTYAEEAKIHLSVNGQDDILSNLGELGCDDDGEEMELDLTITQKQAFSVMRPSLQKAVDSCLELLRRNNLTGSNLNKIILVGGPTRLPLVQQMLSEQIAPVVDNSIDPMTAVATGAALYASTIDLIQPSSPNTSLSPRAIQLEVGYEATTVELTDWVSLKLALGQKYTKVTALLTRADKAWDSGRVEVNTQGRVVTVQLVEGRANAFNISLTDEKGNALEASPDSFTILQGTRVGSAVLPYHIGISVWSEQKADGVFMPFMGLEKNKSLPAVGVIRNRHTTCQLRPGVEDDMVKIPVYQADSYQHLARAYLYEWVADVVITGDEVPCLIPKGSIVEVTLRVDSSEQMTLEAYFPEQDCTVEKHLDTSRMHSVAEAAQRIIADIASAYGSLAMMAENGIDVSHLQQLLADVEADNRVNTEKKAVLQHLKEVLRRIEALEGASEWEHTKSVLLHALEELKTAQACLGNSQGELRLKELQAQVDEVLESKDEKTAKRLAGMMKKQKERLLEMQWLVNWVSSQDLYFHQYDWTNADKARKLIDSTKQIIEQGTTLEQLNAYANAIYAMKIKPPQPEGQSGSSSSTQKRTATDDGDERFHRLLY